MGETHPALGSEDRSGLESLGKKAGLAGCHSLVRTLLRASSQSPGSKGLQLLCTLKPLGPLTRPSLSPCSRFRSP